MRWFRVIGTVIGLAVLGVVFWQGWRWTIDRVYVEQGQNLMLRYKGPLIFGRPGQAKPGHFAKVDEDGNPLEIGVLAEMRGPGRHFYCPIWWERTVVPDIVVKNGEVAIVSSKLGDPAPKDESGDKDVKFLVDGDLGTTQFKGILRKVFGPGRYRANPYAYQFNTVTIERELIGEGDAQQEKVAGWVDIPTGYVGVVTYKADNPSLGKVSGVQKHVLPPGIYPVNPNQVAIDIVEIGYRESTLSADMKTDENGRLVLDESGEPTPIPETGINFPSDDAFEVQMDFTAIWGIMPANASDIVDTFGNVQQVENKVVLPQAESICRNNGSKLKAEQLLVGESREAFQTTTTEEFDGVLEGKKIDLLYGLVRQIYIPQQVRLPIQEEYIADELKLTRDQEKITAETEANLREAEQQVVLEGKRVEEQTKKLVAEAIADGEKQAKELAAEAEKEVAAIDKQAAELDAQKRVVLGQADATAEKLSQEARANLFNLAVAAFGAPEAYTKYQFADGIPDDINLRLFYAGEGTLWTDSGNFGVRANMPITTGKPSTTSPRVPSRIPVTAPVPKPKVVAPSPEKPAPAKTD